VNRSLGLDGHPEDLRDRIALHALGILADEERRELEDAFAADADLREEAARAVEAATSLAFDAEEVPPPEGLRERILAAIAGGPEEGRGRQVWKEWTAGGGPGPTVARADDGEWEETGFPGVRARRLFVNPGQGRVTMIVRMAPGSSYPPHRHGGFEECYVLEGRLAVGDTVLSAGDYQCMPRESVHGVQSTETGCLLLLTSSTSDELLD